MNVKTIMIYLGHIIGLEGMFMIPAALIAYFCGEGDSFVAFASVAAAMIVISFFISHMKKSENGIYAREGFVIVALAWIVISFFGALPFYFSGTIPKFIDCWFETVSGFTTTGATILTEIESLPRSILYWRSFTHWLGGMGVLVFMLAVVSHSRNSGETLHLLRAESPGPVVGKLTPTMRSTTRILYGIYIAMTVILVVLLLLGGMSLFDAVTHAFSTAGTGGFSTMNNSVAAFQSPYIHTVIAVFMLLFGVNFNVYYLLLMRKVSIALANEELKAYFLIVAGFTAAIAINIMSVYDNFGKALLDSFFQVSSLITTTGFMTADFNIWPEFSRYMLMLLLIVGASAGSTGGGIKVSRMLILAKSSVSEIKKLAHPHAINAPRMDGKRVEDSVVRGTYTFMTLYFFICIISMGLIAAIDRFSFETTVTAVITCMSNVGPGLDAVGPTQNFSAFTTFSKLLLSFDMLAGRLEIFPMIMLFTLFAGVGRKKKKKTAK